MLLCQPCRAVTVLRCLLLCNFPRLILTDGDVVFQPLKIERSGLAEAFGGRELIYVHKEKELAEVERCIVQKS